ncbi:cellulose biosynthesis cyclic di-GMP-binding regulatory protein BcsB [Enterobacter hormaechei]
MPFFDPRDNRPLNLPMVFAGSPDVTEQLAASIVASWFGSRSGWRGRKFPGHVRQNARYKTRLCLPPTPNARHSCVTIRR